jgi:photosystem II stability/assembly factor-like uncharacterized protein
VFLSTNNGDSWVSISNGLPKAFYDVTEYDGVYSFALVPNGEGKTTLVAGTGGNGVFVSSDNGTNWRPTGLTKIYVPALSICQNGLGGINIFAGTGEGVFVSTNSGSDWSSVSFGLMTKWIKALAVSGNTLFAGTEGNGVFLSKNDGVNWIPVNFGISNANIHSFAISDSLIFAGTRHNGVFCSTNNGANWTAVNTGLPIHSQIALVVSGTKLFAGVQGSFSDGGVFLSTNNGASWSEVSNGLPKNDFHISVNVLIFNKNSLFAGTDSGVFLSTNDGSSWTKTSLESVCVTSFIFNGNSLIVGTQSHGIFISHDNGINWITANHGLGTFDTTQYHQISALTVRDNCLLAGTNYWVGNERYRSSYGEIYRSTNNGINWERTSQDSFPINSFLVDGLNIYAGTLSGLYRSTNNGETWTAIKDGLQPWNVSALTIMGNYIIAGGCENGMLRRPLSEMTLYIEQSSTPLPEGFELRQNYPNPFNPSTILSYSVPERSKVRLSIFNTLGQQVSQIVNDTKEAGYYENSFNASQLSSGIYFYRIEATSESNASKTFEDTKKMVLMR